MRYLLIIMVLGMFAGMLTGYAEEASAEDTSQTEPAVGAETVAGRYVPEKQSSFRVDARERNPFWPIGWKKPEAKDTTTSQRTVVVTTPELKEENFRVTSILLGSPALVVMNGKEFAEGDKFVYGEGRNAFEVRVEAIRDGLVVLEYAGKRLTVHKKY